jgi:FxLD family lantipeptide
MNIHTLAQMQVAGPAAEPVELDLSVSIVTAGPVSAALLSSTDDGCDTQKGGDC